MKDDIILPYSPKVKKTKFKGSPEYNIGHCLIFALTNDLF